MKINSINKSNTIEVRPGFFVHKTILDRPIDFKFKPGDIVVAKPQVLVDVPTNPKVVKYIIAKPSPGSGRIDIFLALARDSTSNAYGVFGQNLFKAYEEEPMNIKQSYLKDRELAIKNGHKVENEVDDFLMWCEAKNIIAAHDFIYAENTDLGRFEIKVSPDNLTTNIKIVFDDNFSTEKLGGLTNDVVGYDIIADTIKPVISKVEQLFEQETQKFR